MRVAGASCDRGLASLLNGCRVLPLHSTIHHMSRHPWPIPPRAVSAVSLDLGNLLLSPVMFLKRVFRAACSRLHMHVRKPARQLPCATSPGPVYQPNPSRPATVALRMPPANDWADKRPLSRKMTRFGYLVYSQRTAGAGGRARRAGPMLIDPSGSQPPRWPRA